MVQEFEGSCSLALIHAPKSKSQLDIWFRPILDYFSTRQLYSKKTFYKPFFKQQFEVSSRLKCRRVAVAVVVVADVVVVAAVFVIAVVTS